MDSIKSKSLCILEETDEKIVYLTYLVQIVQEAGDEHKSYAGGNELFLRYETWEIMKKEKDHIIQNRAILHSVPERVAMIDGGSYDTAAFYLLTENQIYNENGTLNSHTKPSEEWTYVGLAGDNGIYTQIENYFHDNKAKIRVIYQNIGINP